MFLSFPSVSSCPSNSTVGDFILTSFLFTCLKETYKAIVMAGSVPSVCYLHFVVNAVVSVLVWYHFCGYYNGTREVSNFISGDTVVIISSDRTPLCEIYDIVLNLKLK